ncbi:MAG: hypothetical protein KJ060_09535 [Candidatus Hydrogenedentes bacterium]|nr:hypothetical protein [Candidatus Hydrogenedentota bacterium]
MKLTCCARWGMVNRIGIGYWERGLVAALVTLAFAVPGAFALPDLALTMSDSPDPAVAGDLITYVIDLENTGDAAASNVNVQLLAPAGTILVQFQVLSGSGWTNGFPANGIQFIKTSMAAAETAQFQVKLKIDKAVVSGTIVSTMATATTSSTDANAGNNSATETTTVATASDLRVTVTESPDPVDPGSNLVYMYTVSNFGPSNASNITVIFPTPPNTTFVSAVGPQGGFWTLGAPPAGQSGDVTFTKSSMIDQEGGIFQLTVRVDDAATGVITGQVSVISDTSEAAPGDETATTDTTVNATGPEPCAFTVLKPNGGQTWTIGDKRPLRWDSTGLCCEEVRIQLWQNGQRVKNIKKSTPNDGKAPWLIKSPKFSPGTNYRVRIYCPGDNASQDFSNGTITLVAP